MKMMMSMMMLTTSTSEKSQIYYADNRLPVSHPCGAYLRLTIWTAEMDQKIPKMEHLQNQFIFYSIYYDKVTIWANIRYHPLLGLPQARSLDR